MESLRPSTEYAKLYQLCNTFQFTQHSSPVAGSVNNTSLPIEVSDNANTIIAGINTADTDDIENPVHIVWKLLPSVLQYLVKI